MLLETQLRKWKKNWRLVHASCWRSVCRMVRVVSAAFWGFAAIWLWMILDQGKASSWRLCKGSKSGRPAWIGKERMVCTLDAHAKSMARRFTTEILWDNWIGSWWRALWKGSACMCGVMTLRMLNGWSINLGCRQHRGCLYLVGSRCGGEVAVEECRWVWQAWCWRCAFSVALVSWATLLGPWLAVLWRLFSEIPWSCYLFHFQLWMTQERPWNWRWRSACRNRSMMMQESGRDWTWRWRKLAATHGAGFKSWW